MGRPRKDQKASVDKSENKVLITPKAHLKMVQEELKAVSSELHNTKNLLTSTQTAYAELLEIISTKNQTEDYWLEKFDKLAKENDEVFKFLIDTLKRMKDAFTRAKALTGGITLEDAHYHMDLLWRLVEHRFLNKDEETKE